MNCEEFRDLLSAGRPSNAPAQDHLASCAGCRSMMEALAKPEIEPDPKRLDRIRQSVTESLQPVRPISSDRTLAMGFLLLFIGFSLLAALPFGYYGFKIFTLGQKLLYYSVILACAVLCSVAAVQEMVPGSRRRVSPAWVIVTAFLSLGSVSVLVFQNFNMHRFVDQGIPCLRLGCICALASGGLWWLILRKGFFSSPAIADLVAGVFAGLAGVAVLAIHCPIQNAPHVIVWHLGAIVLGGAGATGLGALKRGAGFN